MAKTGAIFEIPMRLVVDALVASGALPPWEGPAGDDASSVELSPEMPRVLVVKVRNHSKLPVVPEGVEYSRRGPWDGERREACAPLAAPEYCTWAK